MPAAKPFPQAAHPLSLVSLTPLLLAAAAAARAPRASALESPFPIDAAARAYETVLADVAALSGSERGSPTPVFDVHLLGMGGEGHINSLFPHTAAVREADRMVVGVSDSPKPPPRRITLTLPAVRRARQVWLVVSGEAKADAVAAAIGGADPDEVPAAGARGAQATIWLVDSAAAGKLSD